MKTESIIDLIQTKYDGLSKSHKKIADYILSNYDKAVFMTSNGIAKATDTSEATVVRFAVKLGYKGLTDFQKALSLWVSEAIEKKKDVTHKIKNSSAPDVLRTAFEKDIINLKNTLEVFDEESFNQAVSYIVSAKKIYIIGLRTSKPLADVLSIYLNLIRPDVTLISTNTTSEIYEQMVHISSDDLLISVGFPDYSVRTIKAMEFANVKSARIVSVTDSAYSPMAMYTSCVLTARCEMTDDVVSLSAAMSLINALIMAVINSTGNNYKNSIASLDEAIENMS